MKAMEASKAVKAQQRETCPRCGPRGSLRYDARTSRLMGLDRISRTTLEGRVVCRLVLGARQHALLGDPAWEIGGADPAWEIGGADLVWRSGTDSLPVTQRRDAPPEAGPDGGVLGVDLDIVNLATDRDGAHCTAAMLHAVRTRYHLRRRRLQKVRHPQRQAPHPSHGAA
jgi:putative transposase